MSLSACSRSLDTQAGPTDKVYTMETVWALQAFFSVCKSPVLLAFILEQVIDFIPSWGGGQLSLKRRKGTEELYGLSQVSFPGVSDSAIPPSPSRLACTTSNRILPSSFTAAISDFDKQKNTGRQDNQAPEAWDAVFKIPH